MKVTYTKNNIVVEAEVASAKELFETIAPLQEILAEPGCGKCKSDWVFQVRNVADGKKTYTYHELRCTNPDCRAALAFGSSLEGENLFPKRYEDVDGQRTWLPDRGWTRWDHSKKQRV